MIHNNQFYNEFGINYPTENSAEMIKALGIQADDKVLDVGGGGAPFTRANVIVDYDLHTGLHRDGNLPPIDERWLAADIHALPFADKSFDFVYCTHVLEHVNDPALACKELMRVAKRGYIETPRKFTELVHGHPTHRWLVEMKGNQLIFEPRCFIQSPLKNFVLAHILNYPESLDLYLTQYRNLSCVQLMWDSSFVYRVKEVPLGNTQLDYNNKKQAAWSHYYFSLNLLINSAPAYYVMPHIRTACALSSNTAAFYELLGCVHTIMGEFTQAVNSFNKAIELDEKKQAITINLRRIAFGNVNSVVLPNLCYEYKIVSSIIKVDANKIKLENEELKRNIQKIKSSNSWKVTKPLRLLKKHIFRL